MARVKKLNRIHTVPDDEASTYLKNGYVLLSPTDAEPDLTNSEESVDAEPDKQGKNKTRATKGKQLINQEDETG